MEIVVDGKAIDNVDLSVEFIQCIKVNLKDKDGNIVHSNYYKHPFIENNKLELNKDMEA